MVLPSPRDRLVIAIASPVAESKAAEQVSLALDWIVNGTHAGYFVAKSKGYYSQADSTSRYRAASGPATRSSVSVRAGRHSALPTPAR